MARTVLWVGLGVFVVLAGGFLWALTVVLRDESAGLLDADEQERGATVPFPTPAEAQRGRHRTAR